MTDRARRLPTVSVGQRIALGFLGVVLIELVLTGIGLWYSSSVARSVDSTRAGISRLRDVDELERRMFAVEGKVDESLLARQGILSGTRIDEPLQDFRVTLDRVVPADAFDRFATRVQLRQIRLLGIDLGNVVGEIALATRNNRWALAQVLRHTEMSSLQRRFQATLGQQRTVIETEVAAAGTSASRGEHALRWYWVTTGAGLLVGITLLGYATTRRITGPVNALVAQTVRVTEGDFAPVEPSAQRDEIGLLSRSFAQMTDRLRTTYDSLDLRVRELQKARDSLRRSATRLEAVVALDRAVLALESPADIAAEALTRLRELVPAERAAVWLTVGAQRQVLAVDGGDLGDLLDEVPGTFPSRIVEGLVVNGELTGALVVGATEPGVFTEEHVEIACEFASEVALAVQQAGMVDEMQRYATELEVRLEELRRSEERFRNLVEAAPDAIVSVDGQQRVVLANGRAEQMFGYPRRELVGTLLCELVPDWLVAADDDGAVLEPPVATVPLPREFAARHHDGGTFPVEITMGRAHSAGGEVTTSIIRDITERKRFEEQLVYLADHDPLTGLPNKRRFEQELDGHLRRLARSRTPSGAVLFLDLDNLKYVNDSLGHAVGDELIRSIPTALQGRLRSTDLMARLGGDEFAILLPDAGVDEASLVADDLLAGVRQHRLAQNGRRIEVTTSIGIAVIDDVETTVGDLLIAADLAMYEAKELGRDRAAMFVRSLHHRATAPLAWSAQIRQALERDEFTVFCQPILDLRSGKVTRYEALVRMEGPQGYVQPGDFLPVAERFGLITSIDRWMVHRAVELVALTESGPYGAPSIEVNLSGRSATDQEFFDFVASEIATAGVDPSRLIFEITETQVIANMNEAATFARGLTELGCQFALDDFGAGFASFYYLKHLPLSYLKLDGDFIHALPSSRSDQVMVQAMAQVAQGLGLQTVAEFVGDAETIGLLRDYGVEYAQGYFIGVPRRVDAEFLAQMGRD